MGTSRLVPRFVAELGSPGANDVRMCASSARLDVTSDRAPRRRSRTPHVLDARPSRRSSVPAKAQHTPADSRAQATRRRFERRRDGTRLGAKNEAFIPRTTSENCSSMIVSSTTSVKPLSEQCLCSGGYAAMLRALVHTDSRSAVSRTRQRFLLSWRGSDGRGADPLWRR